MFAGMVRFTTTVDLESFEGLIVPFTFFVFILIIILFYSVYFYYLCRSFARNHSFMVMTIMISLSRLPRYVWLNDLKI